MSPTARSAAPLPDRHDAARSSPGGLLRPAGRRGATPATAGALPRASQTTAGAGTWAIWGVLCCPVAGTFHRLTSTGPRTHPRLWPSPRPSTSASEAARRLPLLSRGATGLRVEIHIELPTSRRAPLESETDHSCSQRRRAGCSRACGRRGAAALGASRTGRGEARSGLASIPCTCGSYSAARRLPPARGLHVRGHIGGGYQWGVLCSHALTGRARPFVERVSH